MADRKVIITVAPSSNFQGKEANPAIPAAGAPHLRSLAPAFRYGRRYFQISLFASTGWRSEPISLPTEA